MWLRFFISSVLLATLASINLTVTTAFAADGTPPKTQPREGINPGPKLESTMLKYNVPFGNKQTPDNTLFAFADFKLTFVHQVKLSDDEMKRRAKSQKEGVDGGDSMLAPSHHFKIETLFGEVIGEYDLRQVPYHHIHFSANSMKFQLSNSTNHDGRWIVETLK